MSTAVYSTEALHAELFSTQLGQVALANRIEELLEYIEKTEASTALKGMEASERELALEVQITALQEQLKHGIHVTEKPSTTGLFSKTAVSQQPSLIQSTDANTEKTASAPTGPVSF